ELVARRHRRHDLGALPLGDLDDRVARDTAEVHRVGDRVEDAVLHEEDVLARALGHEPVGVEEQRLVEAELPRLLVRQHGVHVVAARLRLRRHDVGRRAPPRAGHQRGALADGLLAQVDAPGQGRDHEVEPVAAGVHAEGLGAVPDQRPDVAGVHAVGADGLDDRLVDMLDAPLRPHADDPRRVEQALRVVAQAEDGGAAVRGVRPDPLEHAGAVVQGVREDADLRLLGRDQLAVEEYEPRLHRRGAGRRGLLLDSHHVPPVVPSKHATGGPEISGARGRWRPARRPPYAAGGSHRGAAGVGSPAMNVLVTGGAGYIGSVTAQALLDAGHRVVVVDDLTTGHRDAVPAAARLVVHDVGDAEAMRALMAEERVEAVMHFAALSLVGDSMRQPLRYYRRNVGGAIGLLEACAAAGVGRFVLSSTAAVYGTPTSVPIPETAELRPESVYGETKLAIERLLHWL